MENCSPGLEPEYLTEAAQLLDVKEDELQPFDLVPDVFNPINSLTCFLCTRGDYRYGALVITAVNDIDAVQGYDLPMQVIYCTPKLHYPFGKQESGERSYHFPKSDPGVVRVPSLVEYEKIDGTNICQYAYQDHSGAWFITYKTRLTPVLKSNRFGDFVGLWNEVLARHPEIKTGFGVVLPVMGQTPMALVYELYGLRNPITIAYGVDIEAKLLFGVFQSDHTVVPPCWCTFVPDELKCQEYRRLDELIAPETARQMYEDAQKTIEATLNKRADGMLEGSEGRVWYYRDQGADAHLWHMFKLKPPTIETAHWSTGGISDHAVVTTAWNALESCDDLTVEYVEKLLAEEFSLEQIAKSRARTEKAVSYVRQRVLFRAEVLEHFRTMGHAAVTVENKREVMRGMSQHFDRTRMADVYNALRELGFTPKT
jgi:hypothetical protein